MAPEEAAGGVAEVTVAAPAAVSVGAAKVEALVAAEEVEAAADSLLEGLAPAAG